MTKFGTQFINTLFSALKKNLLNIAVCNFFNKRFILFLLYNKIMVMYYTFTTSPIFLSTFLFLPCKNMAGCHFKNRHYYVIGWLYNRIISLAVVRICSYSWISACFFISHFTPKFFNLPNVELVPEYSFNYFHN